MHRYLLSYRSHPKAAFTLIELSIVLVIIGLLVGGVLVGRDLINAAAVRSQISQIERYTAAANTFRLKYNYLPGDIPSADASALGLVARSTYAGGGDGNGVIQSINNGTGTQDTLQLRGEGVVFWRDLSDMQLISGSFSTATNNSFPSGQDITLSSTPSVYAYLPEARMGNGNFVYVYARVIANNGYLPTGGNYFGLSKVVGMTSVTFCCGYLAGGPGLTPAQAYSMDSKMDDGMPQSGKVTAEYVNFSVNRGKPVWAAGGSTYSMNTNYTDPEGAYTGTRAPSTAATAASSTTCYDNGNVSGTAQAYSLGTAGENNTNCALSFRF